MLAICLANLTIRMRGKHKLQRLLFICLFLIIGLFGALLVAPNFINWNEYRDVIAENVYDVTGLNFEIRGNINLGILPSPGLLINDVHVANIEGAATADTLTVKTLEVRIALIPLLTRQIRINTVKLVKPILNIEILSDGRNNMKIGAPEISVAKASDIKDFKNSDPTYKFFRPLFDKLGVGPLEISVDDFFVQSGSITYRDNAKGQMEKIEDLNGRFSLASVLGPVESSGRAIIRGVPISYSLATGSILQNRTLPFNFLFKSIRGDSNLRFSGALTQIDKDPKIKGKLNFNSKNLARLISSVDGIPYLPDGLNRTFSVMTSVAASTKGGTFSDMILKLDDNQGTGKISFQRGKKIDLNIKFAVNKLDIDSLLNPAVIKVKSNNTKVVNGTRKSTNNNFSLIENIAMTSSFGPQISLKSLTKGIVATFDLSFEAIIYNKAVVRQVKLNANLEDQEITISQASALLPGSTDVGLQGIIFDKMKTKLPQFEGTADLTTNNLRALLNWIGVDVPGVPGDRLRKLALSGKILADVKKLLFNSILAQIDGTKIKGAVSMMLNKRPLVDISLAISQLNLDGYLLGKDSKKFNLKVLTIRKVNSGTAPDKIKKTNITGSSSVFSILKKFDANLDFKLDELVVDNLPIKKIILRAKLRNSRLTLSNLQVASAAGLSARLSGNILDGKNINGIVDPIFDNFQFVIRGKNLARTLNLLEIKLLVPINKIGAMKLSGTLKGKLKALDTLAELSLFGGRFTFNGQIETLSPVSSVRGKFSVFHPSLSKLVRRLGGNYQPRKIQIGGVNVRGVVEGNPAKMNFSSLSGKVGDIKINGIVTTDLTGKIPWIDADLKTSTIVIDYLLPGQQTAFINKPFLRSRNFVNQRWVVDPRIIPVSYSSLSRKNDNRPFVVAAAITNIAAGAPWTNKAINISFLKHFSADVKLRSKSLQFNGYHIDNVDLAAMITDGVIDIKRLTGKAYDGVIEVNAQFGAAKGFNRFNTRFKAININTGKFLNSLGTRGFRKGALDMVGEFSAHGRSTFELVNKLDGRGTISVRGLDITSSAEKGSVMSGFAGFFLSLKKFSGTVLGKKIISNRTNFNTSFSAAEGVVRFKDMTIKTGLGNGVAKGLVNLPNWQINTDGEIKLSQNILAQVLLKKPSKSVLLPFKITGRLDNPSVKLETSEITKGGIRLPDILNKKMNKLTQKKGINNVLDKILPRVNSSNSKTGSSQLDLAFPSNKLPQNQKITTEDLLKGILRELTN